MSDHYVITSDTQGKASELMDDFIYLLHDTEEIDRVNRARSTVYMNNGDSYQFVRGDRKHTDGVDKTKLIGEILFRDFMKKFKKL